MLRISLCGFLLKYSDRKDERKGVFARKSEKEELERNLVGAEFVLQRYFDSVDCRTGQGEPGQHVHKLNTPFLHISHTIFA